MAGKKVLIIGGVAGGASCAARLRRLDEQVRITIIEKGPYISFSNCGLPYYIGGVIEERSALLIQTPERFWQTFRVESRTNSEAVSIDRAAKSVEIRESGGRTYSESYDYLVLSPGAEPIRPRLPGIDLPGILTLRNIPDMDRIVAYIEEHSCRTALVVGGGYIGLEVAENLKHRDLQVAVAEKLPQVMLPLDWEMANILHDHLRQQEIAVWLGDGVASFESSADCRLTAVLESGSRVPADVVILSIGVRPDVALARRSGVAIGALGGITVDEHMRTSDPLIFAVGDAVEVPHFVTGKRALLPLAGPANRQGRIAADNICGRPSTYKGSQGTSIVKVFDLVAAATGANEKMLRAAGIPYARLYLHPSDHAGYYPHAAQMSIKVLFGKDDGRILGAQIVGPRGVDKCIDTIAVAQRAGLTVYDLENQELAYAPPYGSAKDPLNMIGFIASNIISGLNAPAYWDDIAFPLDGSAVLLDVRSKEEWDAGHVPGATLIPLGQLRNRLKELPRDKEILAYCGVGIRSYAAARILSGNGFSVRNVSGGYKSFRAFHPELAGGVLPCDMFADLQGKFCCAVRAEPRVPEEEEH